VSGPDRRRRRSPASAGVVGPATEGWSIRRRRTAARDSHSSTGVPRSGPPAVDGSGDPAKSSSWVYRRGVASASSTRGEISRATPPRRRSSSTPWSRSPVRRSVVHALRDCLSVEEAAQYAAQLSMLIRGLYHEGWDPSRVPRKMTRVSSSNGSGRRSRRRSPAVWRTSIKTVVHSLRHHVTEDEWEDVKASVPKDLNLGPDIEAAAQTRPGTAYDPGTRLTAGGAPGRAVRRRGGGRH
jgi:uncharacterized protein (DUF2267 family)